MPEYAPDFLAKMQRQRMRSIGQDVADPKDHLAAIRLYADDYGETVTIECKLLGALPRLQPLRGRGPPPGVPALRVRCLLR